MQTTPTLFKNDIFNMLDHILETGKPLEINRNGHIFKVVPPKKINKLDRLIAHPDVVVGNSDDIVNIDFTNKKR
jgi:N-acyl-D-aspartate/D-glutamate deacylase